jgi:hypothetical protein
MVMTADAGLAAGNIVAVSTVEARFCSGVPVEVQVTATGVAVRMFLVLINMGKGAV